MNIKLDENIPFRLKSLLQSLGHEVDTVPEEGLASRPDKEVWSAVQSEGKFFITQDLDFSDIRKFTPGSHYGILVIRLGNPGRLAITAKVMDVFKREKIDSWHKCFIVLGDNKLRVIGPKK
jgi:predicted nuclease of predicted toxin-antitoxin system